MKKFWRSLVVFILISPFFFCKKGLSYFDNYPPYTFKKGPPRHLETKALVDFDKPRYLSKDGKISARLKEKAEGFDFLLKDGKFVLVSIKEDKPPLPNSVYQVDLDANGLKDFIIFYNYRGDGSVPQRDRVEIFLKKKQGVYQKISYDTLSSGLEDFVDLDKDGKYEVIITAYYSGTKHNYFTYNIYKMVDYKLINANTRFRGYPKFVWVTYKANDKDTSHLTQDERLRHSEKVSDSMQNEEVSAQ